MADIVEIVRKGRDNPFSITVDLAGVPVDFSAATSFELIVNGTSITTGIAGDAAGNLTFNIQDEDIPVGNHQADLVVYDGAHPGGQVIADAYSDDKLTVKFV